ncbi:DUF4214 domain-containing protein [Aquihabitans sp. McL0605]|uniref:DUF4214 domain-containing protein n=1 Tax=Aquihabitans sp. McL0605 TaxID=3415671 RepID=UPI003CFAB7C3
MPTRRSARLGVSALLGAAVLVPALALTGPPGAGATAASTPAFGPQVTVGITGIYSPYGVVVDGTGTVTATSFADDADIAAGVVQRGSGAQSSLDFGDLGSPWAVARDSAGNLYVADASSNVVLKKAAAGGAVTTLSIDGLAFPTGVAVDSDGNVYVADSDNGRIVKEPADGGAQSDVAFTGLQTPYGVAVDSAGTLYVADLDGNDVVKRTSAGVQTTLGFTGLSSPDAVAVDSALGVYVSDGDNDRVLTLPAAGGTQATLGFTGLSTPAGISVSPNGSVYVADSGNDRIVELPVPANSANQSFVIAAYTDFIQRTPTSGELSAAVTKLNGGQTHAAFLTTLANSDVWLNAVVQKLYVDTLGRQGDPGGVAYWTTKIRNKTQTVAQVSASFYSSNEYFRGFGHSDNATWVKDLFQKVVLRQPTSAEVTKWVNVAKTKSRTQVSLPVFQSDESARVRVTALYQKLLGRGTDPSGLTYWAKKVVTQGDVALAINLGSSNEYQRRAATRFP